MPVVSLLPRSGQCQCDVCGFAIKCNGEVRHKCRAGLGDMVASGLAAVGITPERVSRLTGRPCGCKRRQQALNRIGRRFGIG